MVRTISLTAEVKPDQPLQIDVPSDIPEGMADVVVVIAPRSTKRATTLGQLANLEFFGMWRDRDDITDSAAFSRELRERAWTRTYLHV